MELISYRLHIIDIVQYWKICLKKSNLGWVFIQFVSYTFCFQFSRFWIEYVCDWNKIYVFASTTYLKFNQTNFAWNSLWGNSFLLKVFFIHAVLQNFSLFPWQKKRKKHIPCRALKWVVMQLHISYKWAAQIVLFYSFR